VFPIGRIMFGCGQRGREVGLRLTEKVRVCGHRSFATNLDNVLKLAP
jgi:hypothetical protein